MCIQEGGGDLPSIIIDPASISINLDNQGIAVLQMEVLTTSTKIPNIDFCNFDLGEVVFKGFLIADSPQRFEGTNYFSHQMTARGGICDGDGGGNSLA